MAQMIYNHQEDEQTTQQAPVQPPAAPAPAAAAPVSNYQQSLNQEAGRSAFDYWQEVPAGTITKQPKLMYYRMDNGNAHMGVMTPRIVRAASKPFWSEPLRVVRFKNMIDSMPEGEQLPEWLEADKVNSLYNYLEFRNPNKAYEEWQGVDPSDPNYRMIEDLRQPPQDMLSPFNQDPAFKIQETWNKWSDRMNKYDQNYQQILEKEGKEVADFYAKEAERAKGLDFSKLEPFEQLVLSLNAVTPGYNKPDWVVKSEQLGAFGKSAIGTYSTMGLLSAGVAGVGGAAVAGIPFMAISALAGLGAGFYAAYKAGQGETVGANSLMALFNKPAELAEQLIGASYAKTQLQYLGGDPHSFDQKTWMQAGRGTYEAAGYGLGNLETNAISLAAHAINPAWSSGLTADPGQVWQFQKGIVEPQAIREGMMAGLPMLEAAFRIRNGEDSNLVYEDMVDRYGYSGTKGDFILQSWIDPVQYIPFTVTLGGEIISGALKNPQLAKAFTENRGNLIIDSLPGYIQTPLSFGINILNQFRDPSNKITWFRPSGGIFDVLDTYQYNMRWAAGADGTFLPKKIGEMSSFEKTLSGIDKQTGKIKEMVGLDDQVSAAVRRHTNSLADKDPQTKLMLFGDNLQHGLDVLWERSGHDMDRFSIEISNVLKGDAAIIAGDVSTYIYDSAGMRTLSSGLRQAFDSNIVKTDLQLWTLYRNQRKILAEMSAGLNMQPNDLLKMLSDGKYKEALDSYAATTRTGQLKNQIVSGLMTPEIFKNTMGGMVRNKMPFYDDEMKHRLQSKIQDSMQKYLFDKYGLKPEENYVFRLARLSKSVQSLLLLGLNPNFLMKNLMNNVATMAYDRVGGLFSQKLNEATFKKYGVDMPVRAKEGYGLQGLPAPKRKGKADIIDKAQAVATKIGKYAVFAKWSGMVEEQASLTAAAVGMTTAHQRLWREGVAIPPMEPGLAQALIAIGIQPSAIYKAIRAASTSGELLSGKTFNKTGKKNQPPAAPGSTTPIAPAGPVPGPEAPALGRVFNPQGDVAVRFEDALDASFKDLGLNEDVAIDLLAKTGAADAIKEDLRQGKSIDEAVDNYKATYHDQQNAKMNEENGLLFDKVNSEIATSGMPAIVHVMDKIDQQRMEVDFEFTKRNLDINEKTKQIRFDHDGSDMGKDLANRNANAYYNLQTEILVRDVRLNNEREINQLSPVLHRLDASNTAEAALIKEMIVSAEDYIAYRMEMTALDSSYFEPDPNGPKLSWEVDIAPKRKELIDAYASRKKAHDAQIHQLKRDIMTRVPEQAPVADAWLKSTQARDLQVEKLKDVLTAKLNAEPQQDKRAALWAQFHKDYEAVLVKSTIENLRRATEYNAVLVENANRNLVEQNRVAATEAQQRIEEAAAAGREADPADLEALNRAGLSQMAFNEAPTKPLPGLKPTDLNTVKAKADATAPIKYINDLESITKIIGPDGKPVSAEELSYSQSYTSQGGKMMYETAYERARDFLDDPEMYADEGITSARQLVLDEWIIPEHPLAQAIFEIALKDAEANYKYKINPNTEEVDFNDLLTRLNYKAEVTEVPPLVKDYTPEMEGTVKEEVLTKTYGDPVNRKQLFANNQELAAMKVADAIKPEVAEAAHTGRLPEDKPLDYDEYKTDPIYDRKLVELNRLEQKYRSGWLEKNGEELTAFRKNMQTIYGLSDLEAQAMMAAMIMHAEAYTFRTNDIDPMSYIRRYANKANENGKDKGSMFFDFSEGKWILEAGKDPDTRTWYRQMMKSWIYDLDATDTAVIARFMGYKNGAELVEAHKNAMLSSEDTADTAVYKINMNKLLDVAEQYFNRKDPGFNEKQFATVNTKLQPMMVRALNHLRNWIVDFYKKITSINKKSPELSPEVEKALYHLHNDYRKDEVYSTTSKYLEHSPMSATELSEIFVILNDGRHAPARPYEMLADDLRYLSTIEPEFQSLRNERYGTRPIIFDGKVISDPDGLIKDLQDGRVESVAVDIVAVPEGEVPGNVVPVEIGTRDIFQAAKSPDEILASNKDLFGPTPNVAADLATVPWVRWDAAQQQTLLAQVRTYRDAADDKASTGRIRKLFPNKGMSYDAMKAGFEEIIAGNYDPASEIHAAIMTRTIKDLAKAGSVEASFVRKLLSLDDAHLLKEKYENLDKYQVEYVRKLASVGYDPSKITDAGPHPAIDSKMLKSLLKQIDKLDGSVQKSLADGRISEEDAVALMARTEGQRALVKRSIDIYAEYLASGNARATAPLPTNEGFQEDPSAADYRRNYIDGEQATNLHNRTDAVDTTLDQGSVMQEAWPQVEDLLGSISRNYRRANPSQTFAGLRNLPADVQQQFNTYMREVVVALDDTKLKARMFGMNQRDAALLNYKDRIGADKWLDVVYPYQFWYTRSMMEWAKRAINRPAILSQHSRMQEMAEKLGKNMGKVPVRLQDKFRIPWAFAEPWMGNALYINPWQDLMPLNQLLQPYQLLSQKAQGFRPDLALSQMVEDKRITREQAEQILKDQTGPLWEEAVALAQERNQEGIDPYTLASMFMSPNMLISEIIARFSKKKQPNMPLTNMGLTLQSASNVLEPNKGTLQDGIKAMLKALGKTLELPEKAIRGNNFAYYGGWGDYLVKRELSNLAAEGADPELIVKSMIEGKGELWDKANARVMDQVALKLPGSALARAIAEGEYSNFPWAMVATLFPAGLFPEGEMRQLGLKEEMQAAWDKAAMGDKTDMSDWFKEHKEYQARMALNDEPRLMLKKFLVNQIMDFYTNEATVNKGLIKERFGDQFINGILNPGEEGIDYESLNLQELSTWSRTLKQMVPETEATADLDTGYEKLDLLKPDQISELNTYFDTRKDLFPDHGWLNQQYAMQKDDRSKGVFLSKYPELQTYWNWKKQYLEEHPFIAEWNTRYDSPDKIEKDPYFGVEPSVIQNYYAYRNQQFPNAGWLNTEYFKIPDDQKQLRRSFLAKYPELQEFWDWKKKAEQGIPDLAYYNKMQDAMYAKKELDVRKPSDLRPEQTAKALSFLDLDQFVKQDLMSYYTWRTPLPFGSKAALKKYWDDQGRPGNSFEDFLDNLF